jgi:hypothetical protein
LDSGAPNERVSVWIVARIPNGILDSRMQRFTPASSLHLLGMSYPDRGIEIDAAAA